MEQVAQLKSYNRLIRLSSQIVAFSIMGVIIFKENSIQK